MTSTRTRYFQVGKEVWDLFKAALIVKFDTPAEAKSLTEALNSNMYHN